MHIKKNKKWIAFLREGRAVEKSLLNFRFSSAYSMDVIAGVAFGIQINSLKNPDEQFVKVTNRILYAPPWMLTVLCTRLFS